MVFFFTLLGEVQARKTGDFGHADEVLVGLVIQLGSLGGHSNPPFSRLFKALGLGHAGLRYEPFRGVPNPRDVVLWPR